MENLAYKQRLAEYLLQIKAIQLNLQNPFTWASGWKSPVYCDNRKLLSYPEVREFVRDGLVMMVNEYFPQADCIAGVATAGIPHAALIANDLHLPMVYVRSKPKEHGMGQMIEGDLKHGWRVVVVEDTISTGKSSLKAVQDLREAGAEVIGMVAIYKYGFDIAQKRFEDDGVVLKTLTNYNILQQVAAQTGHIGQEDLAALDAWRSDPENWKK